MSLFGTLLKVLTYNITLVKKDSVVYKRLR